VAPASRSYPNSPPSLDVPIDSAVQASWKAAAFPSTYVIDGDGKVAWSVVGAIGARDLEAVLARHASSTRVR
jgi:hypothetical protein